MVQLGKFDEKSEKKERSSLFRLVIHVLHHGDISKVMWRQKFIFYLTMVQQDVILNVIPFFRILGIHLIILACPTCSSVCGHPFQP